MASSPQFIRRTDQQLVVIFGGSGFIGRHVVRVLAAHGFRVRVACRRPDLAGHLQPLGNVGQIQYVQANVRYRWSVERAVEGADVVVNLAGISSESGKQTFEAVNVRGAGWVAEAAKEVGAKLVQISAIGADNNSNSAFCSSKARGETAVQKVLPDTVILRPSIVFGPEDEFFNRFATMAAMFPIMPLFGGGKTQLQPVYAGDVAKAVQKSVGGDLDPGSIWELGGPEVLSFKQCMGQMLEIVDRERLKLNVPFGLAKLFSLFAQFIPGKPITPSLVEMLKTDFVVSETIISQERTLDAMGVLPTSIGAVLPKYLVRFRKHGQFEENRGL